MIRNQKSLQNVCNHHYLSVQISVSNYIKQISAGL